VKTAPIGSAIIVLARPEKVSGNGVTRTRRFRRKVQGHPVQAVRPGSGKRKTARFRWDARSGNSASEGWGWQKSRGYRSGGTLNRSRPKLLSRQRDDEFPGCMSEPARWPMPCREVAVPRKGSTQSAGLFRQLRVCAFGPGARLARPYGTAEASGRRPPTLAGGPRDANLHWERSLVAIMPGLILSWPGLTGPSESCQSMQVV
jgi:hypothetical protein